MLIRYVFWKKPATHVGAYSASELWLSMPSGQGRCLERFLFMDTGQSLHSFLCPVSMQHIIDGRCLDT